MKLFKQALEEVIQEHDETTHKALISKIGNLEEEIRYLQEKVLELERNVENLKADIMLIN